MDVCFDVCIEQLLVHPKLQLDAPLQDRSGKWHETYTWGDDPNDELRLILGYELPNHITARLPIEVQRSARCIARLEGTALDRLATNLNRGKDDELDPPASSLLCWLSCQLTDSRTWAMIFEWHCDTIDEVQGTSRRRQGWSADPRLRSPCAGGNR